MSAAATEALLGASAAAVEPHGTSRATPTGVIERDRRRDRRHLVLAGAGWAIAVVGWVIAARGSDHRHFVLASLVIAVSLGLCATVTAGWVAHNRRIYRRKGPRTGLPTARVDYVTDWVGRPVTTEWSLVQRAPEIVISAGGEWKAIWPARGDAGQRAGSVG